jgi:elongation factor Ts
VTGMARLLLGEGVEKEETDFAAEVAAAVKK